MKDTILTVEPGTEERPHKQRHRVTDGKCEAGPVTLDTDEVQCKCNGMVGGQERRSEVIL